jgi:GAF domain-containing protein/HAMP domain-containing protein
MIPSSETMNGEAKRQASGWLPGWLRRSLQSRITALVLIMTIPLLVAMIVLLTVQARRELVNAANQTLSAANNSVSETTRLWLEYNTNALKTLLNSPDIATMNSLWQKPLLKEMAASYPYMYLVSTTDVNGLNLTRSDAQPPVDYQERTWFQKALSGAPVTYETLIGKTNNRPALVVAMPIRERSGTPSSSAIAPEGKIIGVGMFAVELSNFSDLVSGISLGRGGSSLIVDEHNSLVAHSDPNAALLTDLSDYPPVQALRAGKSGAFSFTDSKGQRFQANISTLPNGWGVIAQQTEAALFGPINQFQQLAFIILLAGALVVSLLTWTTIRRAMHPIRDLTEVAVAVSSGDLTRQAAVQTGPPGSQDELGVLAQTFNQMTDELRELVSGLENRVAERTRELERRALQFQVTSEVARAAAAIRDPERLLQNVVDLISERFGFDHAGIFLLDLSEPSGEPTLSDASRVDGDEIATSGPSKKPGFAVLRAASSEGGKFMVAHGHRLKIGQQGIVGFVAATGQSRIALDVGKDAVFFNNPVLPETRSEMALPLKVQNNVIGVLDVQSNQPSAFSEEDIFILQILADQLALAIENTRLLAESQQTVRELESLYGMQIRQGWTKRLAGEPLVYSFDRQSGNVRRNAPPPPAASPSGRQISEANGSDERLDIRVPIELRGQRIGNLYLRRASPASEAEKTTWSVQAQELVRDTASQLALSLENARLMEEIQSRASQEELINQVVARTQSSLNLETVMKTAVTEIGRMMRLSRIELRLEPSVVAESEMNGSPEPGDFFSNLPPNWPDSHQEDGHPDDDHDALHDTKLEETGQ